jgi:hypothetical protein
MRLKSGLAAALAIGTFGKFRAPEHLITPQPALKVNQPTNIIKIQPATNQNQWRVIFSGFV